MLNVGNEYVPVCSGPTRRSFLTAGSAGLALSGPDTIGACAEVLFRYNPRDLAQSFYVVTT